MNIHADRMSASELSVRDFRARVAWARGNGFATWLWPDIAVDDWRRAMAEISGVMRAIVSGRDHCAFENDDVSAVGLAAYISGLGPLLGFWIETGRLDAVPRVAEMLRDHLSHNRERNVKLTKVARHVFRELSDEGIMPTVLKGMHTAFVYFPDPAVRPVSDIDIYIPHHQMPQAERIFIRLGYEATLRLRSPYMCDWNPVGQRREPRTLVHVHRDDPWGLDVLGSLNRPLSTGEQIGIDRLLPHSGFEDWPISPMAKTLPQPLLALYLTAHVSQALQNVTMVRIYELIQVIRRDRDLGLLDWDGFLAGARTIGGGRFAFPALYFCEQMAPGLVPSYVLAACRADTPDKLRQILAGLSLATVQPLARHSLRERFMWADGWRKHLDQLRSEFSLDGQGRTIGQMFYSYGTKLRAVCRRRMTA
jgi:hypothetical protein